MVFNRDFDVYFSHAISPTPKVSLSVITIKTQQRFHFSSFMICVLPEYITHADKRGIYSLDSVTQHCSGRRRVQQTDWQRVNEHVCLCCILLITEGHSVTGTKPSHTENCTFNALMFGIWIWAETPLMLSWSMPAGFFAQAQEDTAVTSVKRPLLSQL